MAKWVVMEKPHDDCFWTQAVFISPTKVGGLVIIEWDRKPGLYYVHYEPLNDDELDAVAGPFEALDAAKCALMILPEFKDYGR